MNTPKEIVFYVKEKNLTGYYKMTTHFETIDIRNKLLWIDSREEISEDEFLKQDRLRRFTQNTRKHIRRDKLTGKEYYRDDGLDFFKYIENLDKEITFEIKKINTNYFCDECGEKFIGEKIIKEYSNGFKLVSDSHCPKCGGCAYEDTPEGYALSLKSFNEYESSLVEGEDNV